MKTLVVPLVLVLGLAGSCRNAPGENASTPSAPEQGGPPPVVTGTVLDARTGIPIPGALVRGPGGVETKSDARGRFVLRGLALGASGDLVATTEAGLSGKNQLRALEGGLLEVVLHLR